VFSVQSAPMAAHATMDTATEELCFLCDPCIDGIRRTIGECSAVEVSEVNRVG
jgi:hypothetical protein